MTLRLYRQYSREKIKSLLSKGQSYCESQLIADSQTTACLVDNLDPELITPKGHGIPTSVRWGIVCNTWQEIPHVQVYRSTGDVIELRPQNEMKTLVFLRFKHWEDYCYVGSLVNLLVDMANNTISDLSFEPLLPDFVREKIYSYYCRVDIDPTFQSRENWYYPADTEEAIRYLENNLPEAEYVFIQIECPSRGIIYATVGRERGAVSRDDLKGSVLTATDSTILPDQDKEIDFGPEHLQPEPMPLSLTIPRPLVLRIINYILAKDELPDWDGIEWK